MQSVIATVLTIVPYRPDTESPQGCWAEKDGGFEMIDAEKAKEAADTAVILKNDFLNTANWRREKAIAHPEDNRNHEAVRYLEHLAETVGDVDPDLLLAFADLFGDLSDPEVLQEQLRVVGFQSWPESAEQFCKEFIAMRRGLPPQLAP